MEILPLEAKASLNELIYILKYIEQLILLLLILLTYLYQGNKVRYLETVIVLLLSTTIFHYLTINLNEDSMDLIILGHTTAYLGLLFLSESIWGRSVGFVFGLMLIPDALVLSNIISLDVNNIYTVLFFWLPQFIFRQVQCGICILLLTLRWKHKWVSL